MLHRKFKPLKPNQEVKERAELEISSLADLPKPVKEKREPFSRGARIKDQDVDALAKKKMASKTRKPVDYSKPRIKKPKKLTQERALAIVNYQISQRDMSSASLRTMLERRLMRYVFTLGEEEKVQANLDGMDVIDKTVAYCIENKLIDDARYSEMKVRSWRARGWAESKILMEAKRTGLPVPLVEDALRAFAEETFVKIEDDEVLSLESERLAAETLARKKRIGPHRREPLPENRDEIAKIWRREVGIMARAGFSMNLASDVLGPFVPGEDWD